MPLYGFRFLLLGLVCCGCREVQVYVFLIHGPVGLKVWLYLLTGVFRVGCVLVFVV